MLSVLLAQAAASPPRPSPGIGALAALVLFIAGSVWLGTLAQRVVSKSSFIQGYFLGNRGLGAWTIALTATVQSGGTFMGTPSLVYSYGWTTALWIASYMVVPITGFGVLGKRIAQISRRTGAVTMPDLFRERFGSPTVGLVASLLIILFMSFMMIAQFKAGALIMKLAWPGTGALALSETEGGIDTAYFIGLAVFSITVVGYTLIGGFLAAVWTDLFQSVMMFCGVLLLLCLSLPMAGGLENASRKSVAELGRVQAEKKAADELAARTFRGKIFELPVIPSRKPSEPIIEPDPYTPKPDAFLTLPGYAPDGRQFLPLTLAISFFIFWPFTGMASPASVVRIMACKDTRTLRHSIFLLCLYNLGIYLPLIMICICARSIMPGLEKSDEVIPRMALMATEGLPFGSFLAGLVLAAPFGAVMATVSSYLVVIASGLVRDVYQRFIDPRANEYVLRRISYIVMIVVGILAVAANINPPGYLQTFVVLSSGCAASSFLMPTMMLCYWRRATAAGVVGAMLAGAGTSLVLYLIGMVGQLGLPGFDMPDPMIGPAKGVRPYYLLGFEPIVWGLLMSLLVGIVVSLLTKPPSAALVSKLFDREEKPT